MRWKRICMIVEGMFLAATLSAANAEPTIQRVRVRAEELPKSTEWKIDPKLAVLPNGARHGRKAPPSWKSRPEAWDAEGSRCVDDRKGEVAPITSNGTQTSRIFDSGGREYLDRASVEIKDGIVNVKEATRTPLARIADGVWGYRRADSVHIVAAIDEGVVDRGAFYGCRIADTIGALPVATFRIVSSATDADQVMRLAKDDRKNRLPKWIGRDMSVTGSVSKSSDDPAPMVTLVIRSSS